jgi:hypothetical protein
VSVWLRTDLHPGPTMHRSANTEARENLFRHKRDTTIPENKGPSQSSSHPRCRTILEVEAGTVHGAKV